MNKKLNAITIVIFFFALMVINCSGGSDSPSVPKYSVTYDGNTNTEGTAPVDTKTYSTTFSVTVLDKGTLAKEGYTFTCWNTQADGNGTDRAPASTFAMGSANVILYAKWTEDPTYTVTYDANTGSGSALTDTNNYLAGATVTVLGSGTLTKFGYTFTCWNTQADGNGTDRAPSSTFTIGSANLTLYAKWTADPTYTVTYDANTGTGDIPIDSNNYLAGLTVTVLENSTLTKTCHTFSGWNTQADGMGTDRSPLSTFIMGTSDVTLYAKWTETLYTWYRDADGDGYGNISITIQSCTKPVGYVATLGDCNDYNSAVYPTATELCDGIDNNCSGISDEGCAGFCLIGQVGPMCPKQCGVCAGSKMICGSNGEWAPCDYSLIPQYSSGEICSDGLDNDCDCTVDEGC